MAGGGRWVLRSFPTQPILWFYHLIVNRTTGRCGRLNFSSDWQIFTCFYNPSDTRMRQGSSVKTSPVPAKMSAHSPPNAAFWGQGLCNITEKHQCGKFQPDPSGREGHSLQNYKEFGAIPQSSWRLLFTRPALVITAWDCSGKKGQKSFFNGWWGGRMQGFCSLKVYKSQDCVTKTPQKESVVDFHEEKMFQMKMCYKHRASVFALCHITARDKQPICVVITF